MEECNDYKYYYQTKIEDANTSDELFDIAIEASVKISLSEKGCILLPDDTGKYMEVKAIYNMDVKSKTFKWGISELEKFYYSEYLIFHNSLDFKQADRDFVVLNNIKSALILPLKLADKSLASIQVYNKKTLYNKDDVYKLKLFLTYILNFYKNTLKNSDKDK